MCRIENTLLTPWSFQWRGRRAEECQRTGQQLTTEECEDTRYYSDIQKTGQEHGAAEEQKPEDLLPAVMVKCGLDQEEAREVERNVD